MSGRRIYLVGSSGYPQYGDERIAASWLRRLAVTEPDAEVFLDCPNPGGAQLFLGGLHPNLRFVDTLFKISLAAPSEAPEEVADFTARATRQPGFGFAHRAAGVEILQSVDVFHVIGGSYVNTIWPRHLGVLAAGGVLAAEHGVRSAVTGLGLLPSVAPGDLLTRLTAGYEVVDVRDAASRDLFSSGTAAVTATGDDSLLDISEDRYDRRESPSTMMCFQSDLVEGSLEDLATSAVETAKAWGLRGDKIGYVEAIPGQDRVVFEMIEADLPGMRFYPFTEVWREGLPARRGQRWLTTRDSLHVAAAAVGAWGVAFPIKKGYDDVAHSDLVDRGSRWAIAAPGETAPTAHGEAGFGTKADALTEAKQDVAQRVYER
jgi:hypothetical protein